MNAIEQVQRKFLMLKEEGIYSERRINNDLLLEHSKCDRFQKHMEIQNGMFSYKPINGSIDCYFFIYQNQ